MSSEIETRRQTFERLTDYYPPIAPSEVRCPRCSEDGWYLGYGEEMEELDDQSGLEMIGTYPIYCCDECRIIWFGQVR